MLVWIMLFTQLSLAVSGLYVAKAIRNLVDVVRIFQPRIYALESQVDALLDPLKPRGTDGQTQTPHH